MIHQHVMEHEPDVDEDSYHGHGPVFTAHANGIGALLGLPEVVVRNRKGKPKKPKSAQWPHCVQPDDRYGGFYKPSSVTASRDSFFADEHELTPYLQVLELLDQCKATELLELNGLLIRAFAGTGR